jgi:hypothetical protein
MTKVYGAGIKCVACGAEPYPDDPATTRETFTLLRLDSNGRPADSPQPGEWFCEQHLIAKQDLPAKRATGDLG